MESPTLDSFDVAAVNIEATEECSNNANNTDFDNLCWLKKENQDQVDDILVKTEQKYQFNDDLNNIFDNSTFIKTPGGDENNHHDNHENKNQEQHMNLSNQNNMPFINSEFNGAEKNDHEEIEMKTNHDYKINLDENIKNNHDAVYHEETDNRNSLVSFDDFGPETSVDEIVPEEKLNDEEVNYENEELVPMETTISSSPSIEVTTNPFDELNFHEKAEEVIITPSSDLDDDSVDKQLSSVDNTISEEVEDILKSPVTEPANDEQIIVHDDDLLKSTNVESTLDQHNFLEKEQNSFITNSEHNLDLEIGNNESGAAADIDDNKNIFSDEIPPESTMNDSKKMSDTLPQHSTDSSEESDEEWNFTKLKEGQSEKENVFSDEFKENIEPATEKEISSVELKEQLDTTPPECGVGIAISDISTPPAIETNAVAISGDDILKTPETMPNDSDFHLNPEAEEFIPHSAPAPTTTEHQNGNLDSNTLQVKPKSYEHVFDDVVSQSPRKAACNMDDLQLPAENDFDDEIANRPHELLMDEQIPQEPIRIEQCETEQHDNDFLIQNALENAGMKDSLYIENTSSGFNNAEIDDVLNTIQTLPSEEIELEENNVLSNKEGLSLEIDEKDVISPSSDDIKGIATDLEIRFSDMKIDQNTSVSVSAEPLDAMLIDGHAEHVQDPVVLTEQLAQSVPQYSEQVIKEGYKPLIQEAEPDEKISSSIVEQEIEKPKSEPVIDLSLNTAAQVVSEAKESESIEAPVLNGKINVEELNKKNLEESAKLDTVGIQSSKMLEATLGAVAATVKAATIKKSQAPKSSTQSAAKKQTTTATAAKKVGTTSAAPPARPKTAPVKSITDRNKTTAAKTSVTTSFAPKPRVDVKRTTGTTTQIKPKEVTKVTDIKKTTTSARSTVPKVASTTATSKPRPVSTTLTNGISKTTTSKTSTTTSTTLKPATIPPKPRLSPRSTISSTLRKAETMKSPSGTKTASRVDSGLKTSTAAKTVANASKPSSSTLRSKPTATTKLTVKNANTIQRKASSPLDKKKTLGSTQAVSPSIKKSLNKATTPSKTGEDKPVSQAPTVASKLETVTPTLNDAVKEHKSDIETAPLHHVAVDLTTA